MTSYKYGELAYVKNLYMRCDWISSSHCSTLSNMMVANESCFLFLASVLLVIKVLYGYRFPSLGPPLIVSVACWLTKLFSLYIVYKHQHWYAKQLTPGTYGGVVREKKYNSNLKKLSFAIQFSVTQLEMTISMLPLYIYLLWYKHRRVCLLIWRTCDSVCTKSNVLRGAIRNNVE